MPPFVQNSKQSAIAETWRGFFSENWLAGFIKSCFYYLSYFGMLKTLVLKVLNRNWDWKKMILILNGIQENPLKFEWNHLLVYL